MGVDLSVLDFLMKFRGRIRGETLQLGRQGFHIPTVIGSPRRAAAEAVIQKYDPEASLDILAGVNGYTEALFSYLGSSNVVSMDASSYEGSEFVHDLNSPVPSQYFSRFDTIFDGGTIEHVYNTPIAFENVYRMLKPGGFFLSVNAANDQLGHGFYQFSPELLWRAFSKEAGFTVNLMQIVVIKDQPSPVDCPDPAAVGTRLQIGRTGGPSYILLAATKNDNQRNTYVPMQSDFVTDWKAATESP